MTHQLIEINSSYRNRRQFPLQADFDIPINTTSDSSNQDLVTKQFPLVVWNQQVPFPSPVGIFDGGTNVNPIITITDPINIDNKYVGLTMYDPTPLPPPYTPYVQARTYITGTRVIGNYTYCEINPIFPVEWGLVPPAHSCVLSPITYNFVDTPEQITILNGASSSNYYTGMEVMAYGQIYAPTFRSITQYDGSKRLGILSSAFGGVVVTIEHFAIFREKPFDVGYCVSGTPSTITLNVGANPDPNHYIGKFVAVMDFINTYETGCIVTGFNPALNTLTFSPAIGETFGHGLFVYILMNNIKNNYCGLDYLSSFLSQQEVCCYDVVLHSLSLPNVVLSTLYGYVINVPYVYVELTNTNSSSSNTLITNSPYASKASWMVSLTDYPQSSDSPYVRVNCGLNAILKINPNSTLHFTIRLPNGKIFQPAQSDVLPLPYNSLTVPTYSICEPDPLKQIIALFGMKRKAN